MSERHAAENDAALRALAEVESRIREQAGPSDPMSMVWRAHMADLMHVEAVRMELSRVLPPELIATERASTVDAPADPADDEAAR